jgi:hypothetical protein
MPADPLAAALAARSGAGTSTAVTPTPGSAATGTSGGPAVFGASLGSGAPGEPRVRWTPGETAGRWSVRLLRILPDVAPPRALLGLPSGREIVVSPGTMIPEHDLVVMAIGAHAIQVDRIVADGDRTRIETEILHPLHDASH